MGGHAKTLQMKRAEGAHHQNKEPAPVTTIEKIPKAPSYFSREAKELWNHTCESLIEMNNLTLQSLTAVECHVNAVMVMRKAMGQKNVKMSTQAGVIDQARKSASELGLSQQSHAKVRIPKSRAKTSDDARVQEMLG